MFEIDKERFGEFISCHRKKKCYTQKELAERLYISDKAISKWERGISIPDVSLLIPLAEILGVTVTELLESREIEKETEMNPQQVENLVKKAIGFSDEQPEQRRSNLTKRLAVWAAGTAAATGELFILSALGYSIAEMIAHNILTYQLLSAILGFFVWVIVKEKLPAYYDENRISVYSYGGFKIQLLGVRFNNSNWRYIIKTIRIWSIASSIVLPLVWAVVFPGNISAGFRYILLIAYLCSLFLPLYIVGKKYE